MITSTLALSSVIWALALSITRVGAHVHGGANGHNITMTPYVHFTPGDALWFEEWVPITHGAIFGACFGLFQLALVERLLSAMRNVMEAWWKQKTHELMVKQNSSIAPPQPIHRTSNVSASSSTEKHCDPLPSGQLSTLSTHTPTLRQKLPPFIASHDITRGVLHTAQVAIGYALMLAVMTFNGSFILSVLIGLGVGETLFGKYSRPL